MPTLFACMASAVVRLHRVFWYHGRMCLLLTLLEVVCTTTRNMLHTDTSDYR